MKILLISDQFYSANNGLTISARRFADVLEAHGNEVRVLSFGTPEDIPAGKTAYLLKKKYIPVFDKLVSSQGMTFAKVDKKVISEAVDWAEVIHILSPFASSHCAIKLARKRGVPFTAAFHVQPENVSSSIHLKNSILFNNIIYYWFRHYIYRYCNRVHCPSAFIAGELKKRNYKSQLYVISNGIDPDFCHRRTAVQEPLGEKFRILSIGRLSIEKRQDVIIDAIPLSKYSEKIELTLAGRGPRREKLAARAKKLGLHVNFSFFTKPELIEAIAKSNLYVHAADVEIEAMSCMEAFAGGLVPVIANSKKSATPQFALDERSLFTAGDPTSLAQKIDYWIEHPDERKKSSDAYALSSAKYALDDCVNAAERMFLDEIEAGRIKNG